MLWHRLGSACAACYRFRGTGGRLVRPDPRSEGEAHVPFRPPKHDLDPRGARRRGAPRRCPSTLVGAARAQHGVGDRRRSAGWRHPRRYGHRDQPADAASLARTVTDASGFYNLPGLTPGQYDVAAELDGFKKANRARRPARRRRQRDARLHPRARRADRGGHGHLRRPAAADRRHAAQDGRSEGHRAAVVLGPQPDRRGRPQGRRHRRQLQQLRLLEPQQRRLQHQRQPRRREQHHGRRRHRHPHPLGRRRSSASRTSTRSRKCRS